jgi:predicted PurR-regulated permease PerM
VSVVTILVLGGFTTFFLLSDGTRFWGAISGRLEGWRADVFRAHGQDALERVGGYLRGAAVLAAIDAIAAFVFLLLLDVPLAGPLAVLVLITGFIPYVGGFISAAVLFLVAFAANGPTTAVILLALVAVVNLVQQIAVEPAVRRRTVEIHPAIVLVALPTGAALFGLVGLFAALPLTAVVLSLVPAAIQTLALRPDDPGPPGIVPGWLDRAAAWSWRGLAILALIFLVFFLAVSVPVVVLPVILAVVFAATLDPLAQRLRARGMGYGAAAAVTTGLTVLIVCIAVVASMVALVDGARPIIDTAIEGAGGIDLVDLLPRLVDQFGVGFLDVVTAVLSSLATIATILFLALLLTFHFVRDGGRWWRSIAERLGGETGERLAAIGSDSAGILNGYMIGTTLISLFSGFSQWLVMTVLGLPFGVPLGVLTFFASYIPYIGSALTTLLAVLVAVAVGEPSDIIVMAIFTVVLNIVQGNFVTPLVYGRAISLHPAVVLLAIPAGNELAGMVGMFLIVPFLGIVATIGGRVMEALNGPAGRTSGEASDPARTTVGVD